MIGDTEGGILINLTGGGAGGLIEHFKQLALQLRGFGNFLTYNRR